jgi:hypothetical protein
LGPNKKKAILGKWVYKLKQGSNNEQIYKAKLVVRGDEKCKA